jgi:hypothetical protein
MSTFDIATGQQLAGTATTSSQRPPVAPDTPRFPSMTPPDAGPVADATGQRLEQAAQERQDWAAAQAAGQAAKAAGNAKYESSMLPLGASAGDLLPLPPVISDWSKHTGGSDATSYDPAG